MNSIRVRKNFLFDSDVIDKATEILKHKHKNMTEAINSYFQAIIKDPTILDVVDNAALKRTGSFIGMLDGKIGDENFKQIKKGYHESIS
jgi:hypothetical protein